VPVPHFGLILMIPDFHLLADSLTRHGREFVIEPHRRFVGQPGEQWTMFLNDPAGNSLEFKAFADDTQIFAVDLQGEGVAPDLRNALADEAGPAPGAPRPDGRSPQHDGAGQNRDAQ
jgi:hypothetical protein